MKSQYCQECPPTNPGVVLKHWQWGPPHPGVPLLRQHRGLRTFLRTVNSTWNRGWVCGNLGGSGKAALFLYPLFTLT